MRTAPLPAVDREALAAVEDKFTGSITQVQKDYGIAPASNVVLQNIMRTYPH